MKHLKTSIVFYCFLFLISCHNRNKLDKHEGFHSNGNLSFSYYTQDDKREGQYQEFYPNGKLQIQREYLQDTVIAEKILDINGKVLVNYRIRNGEYYGILGSSSCFNVFSEDKSEIVNEEE